MTGCFVDVKGWVNTNKRGDGPGNFDPHFAAIIHFTITADCW